MKAVYNVLNVFPDIPQATLTLTSNMDGGELIRKGDTVYLQCEVKANPSVHTIQWTFEVLFLILHLFSSQYMSRHGQKDYPINIHCYVFHEFLLVA